MQDVRDRFFVELARLVNHHMEGKGNDPAPSPGGSSRER